MRITQVLYRITAFSVLPDESSLRLCAAPYRHNKRSCPMPTQDSTASASTRSVRARASSPAGTVCADIVDMVCTTKETVRISGDDKPAEVVRSRFLKLDSENIRFVVSCMKENTTKIKNIRQYLLATLYNASLTMTSYYAALVQHDMAEGRI